MSLSGSKFTIVCSYLGTFWVVHVVEVEVNAGKEVDIHGLIPIQGRMQCEAGELMPQTLFNT